MYSFDQYDNALVIDGWEKGIADSPHAGISDMRNINIISIPGEGTVNFATSKISSPTITGTKTVTGLSSDTISFSGITGLENGMAIRFTSVGSLTGVSTNTTYWVYNCAGSPTTSCKLHSDYAMVTGVTIGGTAGGATFTIFNVGYDGSSGQTPKDSTYSADDNAYFILDGLGQVWSNLKVTASSYWTYLGLTGTSDVNAGTGIAYYKSTDASKRYIFVWNNQSIDYFNLVTGVWVWGWKPSTAAINQSGYLRTVGNHMAKVMPTNQLCYCDGRYVGRFYERNPNTAFDPTSTATYIFDETALLPGTDSARSLEYLGTNILVGGVNNVIYPWNGVDSTFNYPILLPEFNVQHMVTVNTNTYIFVGNRGRIYTTNGTNAQLYKKVPDHISGTVEPYFTWGNVCTFKNQLYFGVFATANGGTAINQYGGVWAIDMDTEAIRLVNQLSYGTYAGYAGVILPNFTGNPNGTGLYIGWSDGTGSSFGIDQTTSAPYTTSVATIDSDLVPIGTYTKPRDLTQIEYKLSKPLISGESIVIKTRLIFNTTDTGYTTTLTDSTAGHYSNFADVNFQNAQWVQFQIIINSTASNPSYVRLKQIRILGLTGPTANQQQQLFDA